MNKIIGCIGVGVVVSLLAVFGANAQGISRVAAFDRMLVRGEVEMLRDTLSKMPNTRTTLYYHARLDLAEGKTHRADSLMAALKRNEQTRPEALLVKGLSSTVRFDFDVADEAFAKLAKVRISKDTTFVADIARSKKLFATLDRMSQGMRSVRIVAKTSLSAMMSEREITDRLAYLGEVSERSYITRDGRQRWQVVPTEGGGTGFAVGHRLGDGSWEKGVQVKVKGLDPRGEVAYPYLLADGSTLYFSYRGPETLGGWDVYVSRYDRNKKELLVPQQLPMPFNSLADDRMYVLDEEQEVIYLLTDRGAEGLVLFAIAKEDGGTFESEEPTKMLALANLSHQSEDTLRPMESLRRAPKTQGGAAHVDRTPHLVVGGHKVYDEGDLKKSASKALLASFLEVVKTMERDTERLRTLRQRWAEARDGAARDRIGSDILATERMLEEKRIQLRSITNELILSEGWQQK